MEGGIKQFLVTRLDYGIGFDKSLMDSSLVHLMLFIKCSRFSLGLAHTNYALYCHLGFNRFGLAQRDGHGGDLQIVSYARMNL